MKLPDMKEVMETYTEFTGIHPAAELFPLPTQDEFDRLAKDIGDNGLMTEIVRSEDGLLIDGRSRLMACFVTNTEFHTRTTGIDPYIVSVSANMARRNLSVGQRAMVGAMLKKHHDEEAKERQLRTAENRDKSCSGNVALTTVGRSRDAAAADVGVGGKAIDKAVALTQYAPDLAAEVKSGEKTLEKAYTEAKPNLPAKKPKPDAPTTQVVAFDGEVATVALPKKVKFNITNESVSWAKYTWNPVTGCNHGCSFCYAEDIATTRKMKPYYPMGFKPTFHEYRLSAPANTPVDGCVFVCSMADLFGKWVPDEWIQRVFDACIAAPGWEYLFLTKWPKRYQMLAELPKSWFGASVIQQKDVARIERDMQAFTTTGIKWISLEPMLGPIKFNDLSWCDLVVIGSQTANNGQPAFAPEFDWVVDVVNQCRAAGVMYYLKPNLMEVAPGMILPRTLPTVR